MSWPIAAGYPLYPYADALRLAAAERETATGNATTNIPKTAGVVCDFDQGRLMDIICGMFFLGEARSPWVDPSLSTDPAAPVFFTDASMLAAIGATSFIEVNSRHQVMLAAWANQKYAMLNQSRWQVVDITRVSLEFKQASVTGGTWADALAAFAVAPWTGSMNPDPSPYSLMAGHAASADTGLYGISRWRSSWTYSYRSGSGSRMGFPVEYGSPTAVVNRVRPGLSTIDTYIDSDHGYTENALVSVSPTATTRGRLGIEMT